MSYLTLWIKSGISLKFLCESRQVSKSFWQYVYASCHVYYFFFFQSGLGLKAMANDERL